MNRIISTLLAAGIFLAVGPALAAHAEPSGKVFVCKYVGTPGVDERLKGGKNPISVSSNATVGTYFNDAQGRSYVLAEDNGQTPPDRSECPGGNTTPPPANRYRIVIRMTGEGVIRDRIRDSAEFGASGEVYGLSCERKITASFDGAVGDTAYDYGPFTSKHGAVLRISSNDQLLLKLRASEGC